LMMSLCQDFSIRWLEHTKHCHFDGDQVNRSQWMQQIIVHQDVVVFLYHNCRRRPARICKRKQNESVILLDWQQLLFHHQFHI
jgi:hypothetical protein